MKKFKDGDRVKYVKEAPEECNMTIVVGKFTGTYKNGMVTKGKSTSFPLDGVREISNCFEKVERIKK